ncbi:MAG: type II toxin-antitoxin system PrlF family antitoxin [Leptospiraceae bacterium]|nr:type II toxin-antitoxin system PrlF family antitoxin [Leptospiraceae bacterium]
MTTLTQKHQATVPKEVREHLHLKPGDKITYSIENERVYIQKLTGLDVPYLRSLEGTLEEWASTEDDKAYADL